MHVLFITGDKTVSAGLSSEATCRDCSILSLGSLSGRRPNRYIRSHDFLSDFANITHESTLIESRKNSVKTVGLCI